MLKKKMKTFSAKTGEASSGLQATCPESACGGSKDGLPPGYRGTVTRNQISYQSGLA